MGNSRGNGPVGGFTLVELMVTITVVAILLALAVPSFRDLTERSALRGAADNVVAVIAAAKQEAIKRDSLVRVDFKTVGTGFCIGAKTILNPTDAGCDCSVANCPLATYPSSGLELRSVSLVGTPAFGSDAAFVIDPKTGMLADLADAGNAELQVPRGYAVRIDVNAMGRATQCAPSGKKNLFGMETCP